MCDEDEVRRDAVIDNDATMKLAPGLPPWRIGSFRLATVGLEMEGPGVSAEDPPQQSNKNLAKAARVSHSKDSPPPLPGASGGASHTS